MEYINKITSRRSTLKKLAATTVAAMAGKSLITELSASGLLMNEQLKGGINHSVCRWCYSSFTLEELCTEAKKIGIKAIDLVGPKDWLTLKKYNLYSSMCNGAEINIAQGWNDKQYHTTLIKNYIEMIPLVAKAGYTNLICLSGNRNGKDDETGLQNSLEGLKKIMSIAEKNKVMIIMELLNSKVDHKDYQCDRTSWGVELVKRLGSENFKLLYDIYHMQIMEGDIIRTIRDNKQYIAHYHTGGVPGRNEIDETQELNYPAIMRAIIETGFKGYVAQEFIPTKEDKMESLKQAIHICDV
jgi:hydroxypyruvate isomerase